MCKTFFLLLNLVILNFPSLPEDKEKLNPEFYHIWLRYEYYQDIMIGKTPHECMEMQPVMQLYFYPDTNLVLIGSFVEGMTWNYRIKNRDTLVIYDLYGKEKIEFMISLLKTGNETRLIVDDGIEKKVFIGLNEKYNQRSGVVLFINDRFIAGDYISVDDSTLRVTFSSDGKVSGLENFSEYTISLVFYGFPLKFDEVLLRYRIDGEYYFEAFHWKKSDSKLIFYKLEPSDENLPLEFRYHKAKILDKYIELLKAESTNQITE